MNELNLNVDFENNSLPEKKQVSEWHLADNTNYVNLKNSYKIILSL